MTDLLILDIVRGTTVDGPGFRTSVYGSGCTHRCKACHNPQSWDAKSGTAHSVESILNIIKQEEFFGVTFSGGDPLMQIDGFTELAKRIKAETKKNIWCYTGYVFESIVHSERLSKILPHIDVLVDGRYMEALHDSDLLFRGSSNQRIIDVQKSLTAGKLVLWKRKAILVG